MFKEIPVFTVICDRCGKDSAENESYAGCNEKNYAEDLAFHKQWISLNKKHYCPDCYEWGFNDEKVLIIKQSQQINKSTNQQINK